MKRSFCSVLSFSVLLFRALLVSLLLILQKCAGILTVLQGRDVWVWNFGRELALLGKFPKKSSPSPRAVFPEGIWLLESKEGFWV